MAESLIIVRKLKKNTGATIVFALAIFIIAAIMSMVIVNAALNNVQRLATEPEEEQAKLAVDSAMHYLADAYFDGLTAAGKTLTPGTPIDVSVSAGADVGTKLNSKVTFDNSSSVAGGSVTATIESVQKYKVNGSDQSYSVKARYRKDTTTGKWEITGADTFVTTDTSLNNNPVTTGE